MVRKFDMHTEGKVFELDLRQTYVKKTSNLTVKNSAAGVNVTCPPRNSFSEGLVF